MLKNKDLIELLDAGIISDATVEKIRNYYLSKEKPKFNWLVFTFGIFGAILVGLGIILIVAHNWDELSTSTKTVFAFIPLLITQLLCIYSYLRKSNSKVWLESSAVLLVFAVGACISLISQIYNIPGNISTFLMTWLLLCLPLVYLMKSSVTSLLYIVGITYYAAETNYFQYPHSENYHYWWLLLLILPDYLNRLKLKTDNNFLAFHNWLLALSLTVVLGTLADNAADMMYISYLSLFSAFYLLGNSKYFGYIKRINNAYKQLGIAGTVFLLLILSFDNIWEDILKNHVSGNILPELISVIVLSLFALYLLIIKLKTKAINELDVYDVSFLIFILIFTFVSDSLLAAIMINIMLLAFGIIIIKKGSDLDHLGILNWGLFIVSALIICRFFDTDISFVMRGILFIIAGSGFFIANYLMLKRRKTNEK